MGKRGMPFYHIIIADGRAPRGGRFIEKIGYYNPLTKPADIHIDFDKALQWLNDGAQPTDTVNSLLKFKGVLYKKHLQGWVKKGAFTQEQGEARFQAWLNEKESKILSHARKIDEAERTEKKNKLDAEIKIKEARAKSLVAKRIESAREEAAAKVSDQAEEVVAEAAEQIVEAAEPVVEAAEPVVEAAEPVVEAAEPVVEAAEPVVEAAEPVAEVPATETTAEATEETPTA
jgi:small subunit ribosomal protein S16